MIDAGMDVVRQNFSHGTHEFHSNLYSQVRQISKAKGHPVGILQDLQGPKLRLGKLPKEGVELKAGDTVLLYPDGTTPKGSTKGRIALPISAEIAEAVSRDVSVGASILFDDGRVSTRASQVNAPEIVVEVVSGGLLTSHKGMNLPGTPLSLPCCTDKDLEDLKLGLELGVDAIALSFVRSPGDIELVRERIREWGDRRPLVFAKIEREEAVTQQDSIIEVADGIMIARGDMATELGAERVPVIQKQLIHACNELGVPVITATQMLESMIEEPTPTRAEASDIANAVFDGTDAVMLSAESASGKYPIEAVHTMAKIIVGAERATDAFSTRPSIRPMQGSVVDSIEFSASRIAHHVGAIAIACLTHSGMAAKTLSKFRPSAPIVAMTDNEEVLRALSFYWGVRGVLFPDIVATDDLFGVTERVLKENGWAEVDDVIVVTAGVPTLRRGTTNMVKVHRMGAPIERSPRKPVS